MKQSWHNSNYLAMFRKRCLQHFRYSKILLSSSYKAQLRRTEFANFINNMLITLLAFIFKKLIKNTRLLIIQYIFNISIKLYEFFLFLWSLIHYKSLIWSLKVDKKNWKISYLHILWWKSICYKDLLYDEKNCHDSSIMYRKVCQLTSVSAYD